MAAFDFNDFNKRVMTEFHANAGKLGSSATAISQRAPGCGIAGVTPGSGGGTEPRATNA